MLRSAQCWGRCGFARLKMDFQTHLGRFTSANFNFEQPSKGFRLHLAHSEFLNVYCIVDAYFFICLTANRRQC